MISEISVAGETMSFIVAALSGFITGIIYDITKSIKAVYKSNKLYSDILDILYVIISTVLLLIILFNYNGLDLRFYNFLGFLLGIVIYFFTLSNLFFEIFKFTFKIMEKILKFLLYPVKISCIIINKIYVFLIKLINPLIKLIRNKINQLFDIISKFIRRCKKI